MFYKSKLRNLLSVNLRNNFVDMVDVRISLSHISYPFLILYSDLVIISAPFSSVCF